MSDFSYPDRDSERSTPSVQTELCKPYGGVLGAPTPPIYQASLFTFDTFEQMQDRFAERNDHPIYSRVDNPTVREFEKMMSKAEGADQSIGFASGMASITAAVFAHLRPGDRIACVRNVYPDAYRLFERILRPYGIDITYHHSVEFEENPDLLHGVKLAYLESPVSLTFEIMDLARVAQHARHHGCLTMIDNSWATPINQQPLALGIDLVMHSCSKYISGHSDTVAGVVSGSDASMDEIRSTTMPLLGGKLAPLDAFLLIRGLRTLDMRIERHGKSARVLAERLKNHPAIAKIHLPLAGDRPGLNGNSGLFSIELFENFNVPKFCNALTHFHLGVSWGGFESLVMPVLAGQAQKSSRNAMNEFDVSPSLVRLNVGLEDVEDLWADLNSALNISAT